MEGFLEGNLKLGRGAFELEDLKKKEREKRRGEIREFTFFFREI